MNPIDFEDRENKREERKINQSDIFIFYPIIPRSK
jgi:hypothetical protein